jgi:hypothetical protein
MRISVATPFTLNDIVVLSVSGEATLARWPGASQLLRFATTGIYDVSDEIGMHWYTALFATVVDPATTPTATYAIVSF